MRRLLLLLLLLGAAFVLWPRKIERVSPKFVPTPAPRLLKESSLHVPSIEPTRGVGSPKPDRPTRPGH